MRTKVKENYSNITKIETNRRIKLKAMNWNNFLLLLNKKDSNLIKKRINLIKIT